MSCQASLRIAGKAKCYYVYVQHSRTGALTSLKVRLKQYLSITYANPEPMLSMIVLKTVERQCAETLWREPKYKYILFNKIDPTQREIHSGWKDVSLIWRVLTCIRLRESPDHKQ